MNTKQPKEAFQEALRVAAALSFVTHFVALGMAYSEAKKIESQQQAESQQQ